VLEAILDRIDLTQAYEPASFGVKQEHVLDETYSTARLVKMDSERFASLLDPSVNNKYKSRVTVNIYSTHLLSFSGKLAHV
jgi:hypothetical protein